MMIFTSIVESAPLKIHGSTGIVHEFLKRFLRNALISPNYFINASPRFPVTSFSLCPPLFEIPVHAIIHRSVPDFVEVIDE